MVIVCVFRVGQRVTLTRIAETCPRMAVDDAANPIKRLLQIRGSLRPLGGLEDTAKGFFLPIWKRTGATFLC